MPSVVQTQTIPSYMLKERPGDPITSSFTAVNGRTSPPSPQKLNGTNGMTVDTIHVRPRSQPHSEQLQDQKPLPTRDQWTSGPRPSENRAQNNQYSASPSLDERDRSPNSPGKRKRSTSSEEERFSRSPDGAPVQVRRRLDSYASVARDDSPNTVSQIHSSHMEQSQQRTLPPMDRADHDRNWSQRESQDMGPNGAHYHHARDVGSPQDNMHPQSASAAQTNGSMDSQYASERSSTTEITRAGVQVDPKKRKRQFANRTKTGCGTCRRRKKKCDEAKPECNNCMRGGFICEGYAHKVPWPKNGITKPHPPLQAKDQYALEGAQLYHNHGSTRENYREPGPSEGARARPIVVEEHERQAQAQAPRNGWGTWGEPPRPTHQPEPSQTQEYIQPPPAVNSRPPPNEHYAQLPAQGPSQSRQHNPRIYHHTPQTMSQVVNNSSGVTAEAPMHHQSQPPVHQTPPVSSHAPPPPTHYAPPPPRPQKSEKDKMLSGEAFAPFDQVLLHEREQCRVAVHRLNNTSNEAVQITRGERDRHLQTIAAAKWVVPHYREREPPMAGHIGREVFVDTPFHCDYGYNLVIADMVAIGAGCKFLDSGRIVIGRNTKVGANVTIDTQRVPTESKSIKGTRGHAMAAEVHIGDNVYIGAGATITAGVKIGTGAIIYPGSVVLKDIPRDCVARGNPANVQSVNWED